MIFFPMVRQELGIGLRVRLECRMGEKAEIYLELKSPELSLSLWSDHFLGFSSTVHRATGTVWREFFGFQFRICDKGECWAGVWVNTQGSFSQRCQEPATHFEVRYGLTVITDLLQICLLKGYHIHFSFPIPLPQESEWAGRCWGALCCCWTMCCGIGVITTDQLLLWHP